ncbi:hypothetical protein EIN_120130, partial [Entamoeba invadens IP1]
HCTQCDEADSASKCTDCDYGYGLNNNKCEKCGTGCASCNENNLEECKTCILNHKFNSTVKKCFKCGENCESCNYLDTETCTNCYPSFALDGKVCKKCDTGCSLCDPNDYKKCTRCDFDYGSVTSDNNCVKCHPSCDKCSEGNSDTKCTKCLYGNYITVEGKCLACDGECDSFNNDTDNTRNYCNQCSSVCKYTNKSGDDTKCYIIDHCTNYDNVRPGKCIDCESGYYVDGQYTCQKCDAKCEGGCVKSATECITYEPIAYCLIYNKDHTCKTCNYGYKKDGDNCTNVDSCQTRNDAAKCIVCEDLFTNNYYLADGKGHCKDYVEPTEESTAVSFAIVVAIFALVLAF